MDWAALSDDIRARYGIKIDGAGAREVGGGCINRCWSVAGDGVRWFLKVNRRESAAMFAAEARGLAALGVQASVEMAHDIDSIHRGDEHAVYAPAREGELWPVEGPCNEDDGNG
jgi:fructosamine-3-kinase